MRDSAAIHHATQSELIHAASAEALETLATLRQSRARLTDRFAVRSLALFGSIARDTSRADSDVDLLVEFARPIGLLHVAKTALFLEELLGRPVDLVLRRALLPELREGILAEAMDVF